VAIPITVPRLGWSMEEGAFVGWLKADGAHVRPGDELFALESEKGTENVEAIDAGILCIPLDAPKSGDTVKVGTVLGHLLAEGEEPPAAVHQIRNPKSEIRKEEIPAPAPVQVSESPRRGQAISPRARRAARELGVEWSAVRGSGRNGRIRERDVRAAAAAGAASGAGGRLIPHTNTRRTIAARMVAGVTQAAPVTLTTRADATNLVGLRRQFQAAVTSGAEVPGYSDFLLKLTAAALRQHPMLQAQWRDDGLFVPNVIHIAVAVDTDAGLLVPVVRDADRRSVRLLAAETRALVARARAGILSADEMRGATFTISNLGVFGIEAFTPILALPQSAVLGVGRIAPEPVVVGDRIVPCERVTLSLTFDHRVVDGAPAARFLDTLRRCVEQPAPWLID
jgi:pyruvate dehydrogenase E2 component (dihydrolipoamide acetyltransferase)